MYRVQVMAVNPWGPDQNPQGIAHKSLGVRQRRYTTITCTYRLAPSPNPTDTPGTMPTSRLRRGLLALARRLLIILVWMNLTIPIFLVVNDQIERRAMLQKDLFRPDAGTSEEARDDAVRYQETRRALIDSLLPEGHGGTIFATDLGGPAGVAWTELAAIGMQAGMLANADLAGGGLAGEAIEMHERAHLLQAAHTELVAALMDALPAARRGTYASTNVGEHFAEMASEAYRLLRLTDRDARISLDTERMLRRVERRVPGTAHFVGYYLDVAGDMTWPAQADLRIRAERLARPTAQLWVPIRAAITAQRGDNGLLSPWRAVPLATRVRRTHERLEHGDGRMERAIGYLTTPIAVISSAIE